MYAFMNIIIFWLGLKVVIAVVATPFKVFYIYPASRHKNYTAFKKVVAFSNRKAHG